MKPSRLSFSLIFMFIIFISGITLYTDIDNSRKYEAKIKNKRIKEANLLKECFDLKNKNKRSLKESMKLIEYCIKGYAPRE